MTTAHPDSLGLNQYERMIVGCLRDWNNAAGVKGYMRNEAGSGWTIGECASTMYGLHRRGYLERQYVDGQMLYRASCLSHSAPATLTP